MERLTARLPMNADETLGDRERVSDMSDRITEIRKRYAHWQAHYSMLHTEHRQATDDIGYLLDLLNKRDRDIEEFKLFHKRYTEDISKESVALKAKLEHQENTIAKQHVLILELQGECSAYYKLLTAKYPESYQM